MIVKDIAKEDFFVIVAARNMQHSRKKLLMPIRIEKSTRIHNILYMPRKCMGGEDKDVFLFICWNNLIHYISKTFSKSI